MVKRETYIKRLATSYKNLSDSEKKMFNELINKTNA